MIIDIIKLLDDYDIPYDTEGKNTTPGWVNIQCPKCYDRSNHGGFNTETGLYNCWNCGPHGVVSIIADILDIPYHQAVSTVKMYETENEIRVRLKEKEKIKVDKVFLPAGSSALSDKHKQYLAGRNFDPAFLEKEYHLFGTNHLGDYSHRIIIPIYLDGQLISYQGRDITGKSDIRYKACSKEKELVHMKHSLYNIDRAKDRVVVVEGIFDVFRLGPGSAATFGTSFTREQALMLSQRFGHIFVLYDSEAQAQAQAYKLAHSVVGRCVEIVDMAGEGAKDPGDMKDEDARYLMKYLGF